MSSSQRYFAAKPLYNSRFAQKFRDAYVVEPLVNETNNSKDKSHMDGDFSFQGFFNNFD